MWEVKEEGWKVRKDVGWEKMRAGCVCVRCGSDEHEGGAEVCGGADASARRVDCAAKGQCDEDTERCSGGVWDVDGVVCVLFPGGWGVCALSCANGNARALDVLQPRRTKILVAERATAQPERRDWAYVSQEAEIIVLLEFQEKENLLKADEEFSMIMFRREEKSMFDSVIA
ncbi:uncharacterized protein MONOS_14162 [Monocercomonoides exilis]|uniref:uncharacterized protein n=1 Tax=Monocercomonoides exilis TaxID=2049356 RepID=UPI00355ABC18|nr:hypothetical protein MONOS_14162 [Monocercomonoides exilis]|eukprot:MONOS_14162.1-p1 / transcript=MONOS_14162.1 / gene=MONOS_14162 / organism=Monocercomonoides_exilis_PA203 / gene_product=unspecified product / transcript_product=unspecified product / location=Mono_scaffold00948:19960-20475(+) / protein_length=172 / sequence_SO=supercontig / SO=protein_coding / is_pseudo=false